MAADLRLSSERTRSARHLHVNLRAFCDQPRIERIQKPVPAPTEQYLHTIAETDEERNVNCAPQEPCKKATTLEVADLKRRPSIFR